MAVDAWILGAVRTSRYPALRPARWRSPVTFTGRRRRSRVNVSNLTTPGASNLDLRDVTVNRVDDSGDAPIDARVESGGTVCDVDHFWDPLSKGESVSISVATRSGAQTTISVVIPQTLSGESSVAL